MCVTRCVKHAAGAKKLGLPQANWRARTCRLRSSSLDRPAIGGRQARNSHGATSGQTATPRAHTQGRHPIPRDCQADIQPASQLMSNTHTHTQLVPQASVPQAATCHTLLAHQTDSNSWSPQTHGQARTRQVLQASVCDLPALLQVELGQRPQRAQQLHAVVHQAASKRGGGGSYTVNGCCKYGGQVQAS